MNLLFVCSRNKWRSRTAEHIFKNRGHDMVKSCGTEHNAQVKVSAQLLQWADLIFVMEEKHARKLKENFSPIVSKKEVILLGIPDEYQFMDSELVDILKVSVHPYLNQG